MYSEQEMVQKIEHLKRGEGGLDFQLIIGQIATKRALLQTLGMELASVEGVLTQTQILELGPRDRRPKVISSTLIWINPFGPKSFGLSSTMIII